MGMVQSKTQWFDVDWCLDASSCFVFGVLVKSGAEVLLELSISTSPPFKSLTMNNALGTNISQALSNPLRFFFATPNRTHVFKGSSSRETSARLMLRARNQGSSYV